MAALVGCGSKTHAEDDSATLQTAPPQCARATASALGQVAEHVYREIAGGRIARPAVQRVARSPALIAAALADDPAAARAALRPLLRKQLVRLRVTIQGHTLLEYGSANAVAPVSAPLKDAAGRTIGKVVASEQGVLGYADTVHTITQAQIFVRTSSRTLGGSTGPAPGSIPTEGEIPYRGIRYSVYSFAGTGFPSVAVRTFVLTPPPPASTCARTVAETTADTIGAAAKRIYDYEQSGGKTKAVVRDFEHSRPFQEAVANDDPLATEAAIVAFFKSTLHVVRVRATLGEKLVADVGGPHVLAPIGGDVRDVRGRVVGHFLLSVQDDLGYVILSHRFTGAQVFLRQGDQQMVGNASPGPTTIPDRGELIYRGIRYQAYSFMAEAFPSGALRVSLLMPPTSEKEGRGSIDLND
ncbi:MAG: hypothetical protein WAN93_05065 [Solirubrobacteraceae bacterium]